MSKDDAIEFKGVVTEVLPNATFKVKLENGVEISAYLSGKLRMNYIRILQGDTVRVDISPYDLTRGRITWREQKTSPSKTVEGLGLSQSAANTEDNKSNNQEVKSNES